MMRLLCVTIMCLTCKIAIAWTAQVEKDGFRYTVWMSAAGEKDAELTRIPRSIVDLKLPEFVHFEGTMQQRTADREGWEYKAVNAEFPIRAVGSFPYEDQDGERCLETLSIPSTYVSIGTEGFFYCKRLRSVSFSEGLEEIHDRAFCGCSSLDQSLVLPRSLRVIEGEAFKGCVLIRSLSCGNDVKRIDADAFANCSSISSVNLGDGVEEVGRDAFENCTSMARLRLSSQIKKYKIDYGAFHGCTNLCEIIIPDGCQDMGLFAYSDAPLTRLETITIPGSVKEVPDLSFECLKEVILHDGIEKITSFRGAQVKSIVLPDSIKELGDYCFSECPLESVNIPASLEKIGIGAFEGCPISFTPQFPARLAEIGVGAFKSCLISRLVIPGSLKSIGSGAFAGNPLEEIVVGDGVELVCYKPYTSQPSNPWFSDRFTEGIRSVKKITLAESVVRIGDGAFAFPSTFEVHFKGTPPWAGQSIFLQDKGSVGYYTPKYRDEWRMALDKNGRWNGLAMSGEPCTVTYKSNDGTERAVQRTYDGCSRVRLEGPLFSYEGHRFEGWSLKPSGFVDFKPDAEVDSLAERGQNLDLYAIWTGKEVGYGLKYEFRPLPDGESIFSPTRTDFHLERASGRLCKAESDGGWREVASFKSGEPVDIIWGDGTYRVFFGYDNSEAFGEPVWVPFIECEDLTVPMAEDVSRIRYFYDRENYPLEENGQPVKLMVYFNPGEHASCSPQVVELPESVYGRYPFVLESGDIPTPERLTEIDGTLIDGIARIFRFRGWFDGDWQIKGGTAFARGRTFMLGGEVREGVLLVAKWEVTEVEVGLSGTGAWWVEGSSTKWTFDHSFENLMSVSSVTPKPTGDLQIPEEMSGERVASIGRYAFSNCQGLTSVSIPEGVQSIGVQAFSGCYDLTWIDFPSTLRTIEPYAFGWCLGLEYVEIPVGVTTIGEGAFTTCGYLETVVLPEGLTTISSNVFNYCCSLRTVTIPSTVTKIEPTAFNACSTLGRVYVTPGDEERVSQLLSESGVDVSGIEFLGKTPEGLLIDHGLLIGFEGMMQPGEAVVVPDCVTGMVDYVFAGMPMGSVAIPSSVKRISAYAFASCQQLNVVTLASSIETVGDGAFSYCTELGSIVLPAGVTNIGYGAFFSCTNLSTLVFDGNAPTVGERAFEGVPSSCTVVVRKGTSGWNVTIPGQWHGIKIVWCDDSATDEQPFSVSGLGWHEMSFPVLPEGGKPEDVFAPVVDKIGYVTYGSKNWNPLTGGTLMALEIGKGYWVQTTAENVSWRVTGQTNPDVEIALKPGWNLIGYPLLEEGEVETVLATALATDKIDWIYSGSRVYPGTLTTMAPGKGYWVYANAAVTIKFDVK